MSLSDTQQAEFDQLNDDPVYFYEKFFSIPEEPKPFDYQIEVAQALINPEYQELAVLKGRQIGMSWTMGWLIAWYCVMNPGKTALIVAFNLDQAQIVLNYAKKFMARLKPRGWFDMFVDGASARHMKFKNGSEIRSFGCTVPDAYNVRGQIAHLLVVDEAAFIYDKMFPSITPTTSNTMGKTLFLSTAGSVGSYFYRKWMEGNRAEKWRNDYNKGYPIDIPRDEIPKIKSWAIQSAVCPRLSKERLDQERRGLGEMRFRREYECVWAGTADQVFMRIPVFTDRKMPTMSKKPVWGGIDVGKVNDPTVLMVIEAYNGLYEITDEEGIRREVEVPFRVVYGKTWERETQTAIAADIALNIHPRFPSRLYSVDATAGYGDELLGRLVHYELPCRGTKVKVKGKNELMLGSQAVKGLSDAFAEELLWVNNEVNDIIGTELLFELNGYIAKLMASGYYRFDSVVDRDHMIDAVAHAWSSVQAGSFEPFLDIRKL